MTTNHEDRNRHFVLQGVTQTELFRSRGMGSRPEVPVRGRQAHGGRLSDQLGDVASAAEATAIIQRQSGFPDGIGFTVEFESFPGIDMAFESLARENSGIELLNVRDGSHEGKPDVIQATVFVPDGKLDHFENLIKDYIEEKVDSRGRPRDNRRLIDAIDQIRAASLRALWTDTADFPADDGEPLWWEVWLPVRRDREAIVSGFLSRVEAIGSGAVALVQPGGNHEPVTGDTGMRVADGAIFFPERTVMLVHASVRQMQQSAMLLNSIAELRRARETAEFFQELRPDEQQEWLDNLLQRAHYPLEGDDVPHVCLLDTGVNRGHQLLEPALASSDLHSIEPGWGTDDSAGHGTEMAGLALGGDLTTLLEGTDEIVFRHRLESVKLLPQDSTNAGDPVLHGHRTVEAISRPEVDAPGRSRVFGMAVTAKDNRDRGQPSAWSAVVDKMAADADGQGGNRRLLILSAGNAQQDSWTQYPHANDTDAIHDPGQSWNALTVGACTNLVDVSEPGVVDHETVADEGALSPFSTTSLTWQDRWPLKPDLVLEGGNLVQTPQGPCTTDSLSLLTAFYRPNERTLHDHCRHQCRHGAGDPHGGFSDGGISEIMAGDGSGVDGPLCRVDRSYADSAYLPAGRRPSKTDYAQLVRRCGFGVPDLDRALWSVANSLTMVVEETLHPFRKGSSGQPVLRDMQVHTLPWPVEILEDLGDAAVEMRVTLSYFIEPNPSNRGVRSRYRYESHGLRFDVKRPRESVGDFRSRINIAARDEEEGITTTDADPSWLMGVRQRHRGSLHSDIWVGTAADLASRGYVAVYPTAGWWKTRPRLERFDQPARYSLIVSISTPESNVDLYTAVRARVEGSVEIEVC